MIPGFFAQRSLRPRAGAFIERAAPQGGPAAVPAAPPCEACEVICRGNPNCGCWRYCR